MHVQLTIIRNSDANFTLVARRAVGEDDLWDGLTYDEMLGTVAVMFSPDRPGRKLFGSHPLHLGSQNRPDATAEMPPPSAVAHSTEWPHLASWSLKTTGSIHAVTKSGDSIESGISDAIRLAIAKGKKVYLQFNSMYHLIDPHAITNAIADKNIPL